MTGRLGSVLELIDPQLSQVLCFLPCSTLILDLNTLSETGQEPSSKAWTALFLSYVGQSIQGGS